MLIPGGRKKTLTEKTLENIYNETTLEKYFQGGYNANWEKFQRPHSLLILGAEDNWPFE